MSANLKIPSDEFEFLDDPDFLASIDDDYDAKPGDASQHDYENRQMAIWQQIEQRLSERELATELSDWEYWDKYLTVH